MLEIIKMIMELEVKNDGFNAFNKGVIITKLRQMYRDSNKKDCEIIDLKSKISSLESKIWVLEQRANR